MWQRNTAGTKDARWPISTFEIFGCDAGLDVFCFVALHTSARMSTETYVLNKETYKQTGGKGPIYRPKRLTHRQGHAL